MKIKKIASLFIFPILFLNLFLFLNDPVIAQVAPDGSFNTKVDIKLPPGTRGVAPKLALTYNSNAGNGIVGVGWQLSGLPAITRDSSYGINYDSNDHYVGPGGRLVEVNDSDYSGSGVVYHTEDETFSRFEAIGSSGSGPAYWIETKPDGTKYYYGESSTSRISALNIHLTGNDLARAWALSKVEDIYGNYYIVEYMDKDKSLGEIYPVKIVYTLNDDISTYRAVIFEYSDDRLDDPLSYRYNSKFITKKLLSRIEVKYDVTDYFGLETNGELVTAYELDYYKNHRYSMLCSIDELSNESGTSRSFELIGNPKENFTFDELKATMHSTASWGTSWRTITGDFNGDGKTDVGVNYTWSGGNKTYIALSNGKGGFGALKETIHSTTSWGTSWRVRTGDFDGDGKTDIGFNYMWSAGNVTYIALSNGKGGFGALKATVHSTASWGTSWRTITGDFNGDGKIDIGFNYMWSAGNVTYIALSNGKGGFGALKATVHSTASWGTSWRTITGDFNGDGKTDIGFNYTWSYGNKTHIALSNGKGGFEPLKVTMHSRSYWDTSWRTITGDFNGDGKTDIGFNYIYGGGNKTYIALSSGEGYFDTLKVTFHSKTHWSTSWRTITGDFNGDGKTDIGFNYTWSAGNKTHIALSSGQGGFATLKATMHSTSYWDTSWRTITGDFNGDGKTDIGFNYTWSAGNKTHIALSNDNYNFLISNILSNIGNDISITYTPAPQLPGAINPTNSQYPFISNSSPRNLVTKITRSDEQGNEFSTSYEYKNGRMFTGKYPERKNLYFESITKKTLDAGNEDAVVKSMVTYYKQDNEKFHGRVKKVEEYAGDVLSANLLKRSVIEYLEGEGGNGFIISDKRY